MSTESKDNPYSMLVERIAKLEADVQWLKKLVSVELIITTSILVALVKLIFGGG